MQLNIISVVFYNLWKLVTLNSKLKAFTLIYYVYLVLHTCRLGISYKIWGPVMVPSAKAHQLSTVYPIYCVTMMIIVYSRFRSLSTMIGPFSTKRPNREEPPGPPWSQRTTGWVSGLV